MKKNLTLYDLIVVGINSVIGSGIFVLPALLFSQSGPASVLAFIIAGIICFLVALCYAEVGSMFTHSGGAYIYAKEAFGNFAGFLMGFLTLLDTIFVWSVVAIAFINYLTYFYPHASYFLNSRIIIFAIIFSLGVINYFGVKKISSVLNYVTVIKIIPIFLFIFVGLSSIKTGNFSPFFPHGIKPLWLSVYTVIFAFAGFEYVTIPTEEVDNPKKNVPLAIISVILFASVVYIIIQTICVSALPNLGASQKPLADAAYSFWGNTGALIIAFGALASILGINISMSMVTPRCVYAIAEDKLIPSFFGKLHPKYETPVYAIILSCVIAFLLTLGAELETLLLIEVLCKITMYAVTALALIKFRKTMPDAKRLFKVPLGNIIPIITIILLVFILFSSPVKDLIAGAIAVILGSIAYLFFKNSK